MPLKPRRDTRYGRFAWDILTLNEKLALHYGHYGDQRRNGEFQTLEDLHEAWLLHRDRFMVLRTSDPATFSGFDPGTRPRPFWMFEASERPKRIGMRKRIARYTSKVLGLVAGKVGCRTPVFELQEDVLRRLGMITPEEERALNVIKRTEARHVAEALRSGERCPCKICGKHRTYPHRLQAFLPGAAE